MDLVVPEDGGPHLLKRHGPPAGTMQEALQFVDMCGAGSEEYTALVIDDEVEPIPSSHAENLPDPLRDRDLALARDGGAWHFPYLPSDSLLAPLFLDVGYQRGDSWARGAGAGRELEGGAVWGRAAGVIIGYAPYIKSNQ